MKTDPYRSRFPWTDPGERKHLITFLVQTTVSDASGAGISYVAGNPPDTTWAKLKAIKAADVIKGGSDVSQVRLIVNIRYSPGRVPKMRFQLFNGNIYVIEAIENVLEMNRELDMTCLGIGSNE